MAFEEFDQFDATGLAGLIKQREVSATEVVEASMQKIVALNPEINAVVATCFDSAYTQLTEGIPDGPLQGVPYLVKDFHTKLGGLPNTNGCRGLKDDLVHQDGSLIGRMREAGLVILGKSNTPEFGLNICTSPKLFGATRNPLDLARSAGGSSGGAAAAVASGMLPAAHATDSGGSIRIPASNCGLFGLKPSRARIPLGNDAVEGLAGFSTVHAVTHSVRDSALLLDVTQGPQDGDIYHSPATDRSFISYLDHNPTSLRIALWTQGYADETIHADCVNAAKYAAGLCVELGHVVEEVSPEFDGQGLRNAFDILFSANVKNQVDSVIALNPGVGIEEILENTTFDCAQYATRFSAAEYAKAQYTIHQNARVLGRFFRRFDVLLTPTLANPPMLLGEMPTDGLSWLEFSRKLLDEIPFTPIFNATGAPAASIPLGKSKSGLPIGVQVGAALGNEAAILQLARQLEQLVPWHNKK